MIHIEQAIRAFGDTLDGWVEGARANHDGLEHRERIEECCLTFAPDDIRRMIEDARRELADKAAGHTFERCSGPCPVHRPARPEQRLQLAVTYADDVTRYYPVTGARGWRIDVTHRQIVIGRSVPRTMIPLDSVRAYTIEQIGGRDG